MVCGIVLCVVGSAVVLMVSGVPWSAVANAIEWSPALLCVGGFYILIRSAAPRRVLVAALALLVTGSIGLAATQHLFGRLVWWCLLAAVMVAVGSLLIRSGIRSGERKSSSRGAAVNRRSFWRSGALRPIDVDGDDGPKALAIGTFFADVDITVPDMVQEIDATAISGLITLRVPDLRESEVVVRPAFVLTRRGLTTTAPPANSGAQSLLTVVIVALGGDVKMRYGGDLGYSIASWDGLHGDGDESVVNGGP